jgi:tetratricopeptide (TPR) repeat protein
VWAEEPFSLSLEPKLSIPLGPYEDAATPYYRVGGGTDLVGRFLIPSWKPVYLRAMLGVEILPVNGASANFTILSLGAGGGAELSFGKAFYVGAAGFGGCWYGFFPLSSGAISDGSFFAGASGEIGYKLHDGFRVGLGLSYRHHFYPSGGIYDGLSVGLAGGLTIRSAGKAPFLKIGPIRLEPVFPVFYSYYNDNPLGSISVTNKEPGEVRQLTVSLFVPQYMDKPKLCASIATIAEGATVEVPLYGLFTDRVLEITEGTRVTATISIEYQYYGAKKHIEHNDVMTLNNRNAMIWDDDRKAASFVTAKDPAVLRFARNVDAIAKSPDGKGMNSTLRQGIAIADSIALRGVGYAVDPSSPFAETSANIQAVDYLQFPAQTLSYRAGDCDDLSILYCSLLEALGVKTAFITVPGHIYAAFSLDMEEEEARKYFYGSENLIYADGEAWVPVEVTILGQGFAAAWLKGAEQWRRFSGDGKAKLFSIRESWKLFAPVGMKSDADSIPMDFLPRLETVYRESLRRMTEVFIGAGEKRLLDLLSKNPDNTSARNLLGVLYAKFELYEKAEREFKYLLARADTLPALVNLANLRLLQGRNGDALELYRRADVISPDNPIVLVGLAKAMYALSRFSEVDELYAKIASRDGKLAERYAYLAHGSGEGSRASSPGISEDMLWSEE